MNFNREATAYNQNAGRTYDALVIGSGISGGWTAKKLTQKGLPESFPNVHGPDGPGG